MKQSIYISFLLLCLGVTNSYAQDPTFSQFNAAPLQLNPALTGFFNGDFRASAQYRSQWGSFTNAYRTIGASFEASMFKAKMKDDNLAVGLNFYNDIAGSAAFGTNSFGLSFAYRKSLGRKIKHTITLGAQAAFFAQQINVSKLIFDNQYNGVEVDPNLTSGEAVSGSSGLKPDVNVGLLYQIKTSDEFNMYFGGSYNHILQPSFALLTNAGYQLEPRMTGHFGAQIDASLVVRLLPSVAYHYQGAAMQLNAGTYVMFVMDDFNDAETAFSLGAWTRVAKATPDAMIFAARIDFQNVTLGVSYDFNISNLNAVSGSRGAYEMTLQWIGAFTTASKRRLMIPCPVL